jgi:hypothetical protein
MSIFFDLKNGTRAELIMLPKQGERLADTCFRGRSCRRAGNFWAWNNFRDFLKDPEVRQLLTEQFNQLVDECSDKRNHRIEFEFSHDVGWDSAIDKEDLSPEDLAVCELRSINKHASAMFLPDGRIDAPCTNIVTMVLSMSHNDHWKFTIGTIYPGPDCGRLSGVNLTEGRGLVFLDWSNPGE